MVMVLDSFRIYFFHFQILIGVKALLFLEFIFAHQRILTTKKDILILDEGPTQRLDDTTLTAEAKYSINFSRSHRKFRLSCNYNGSKSLFVSATKDVNSKQKTLK